MIADLKPYPEYKESGLPWLGRVPGHWGIRKPRHIGSLLKGVGGTREDARSAGVPCVRYGELYTTHTYFVRKPKTFIHQDRADSYTRLRYGDVLFAASGETLEEIGKSAVNLIEGEAVCGGDVIILRPSVPVHAPFLGYVMDCRPSVNQKATMGRGTTVKHIYPDELKHLLFTLPPVQEQAAIVRFLDWANGRLERAIRAKRKVIALLGEQKQAIIHRAVTRGLDPSVPLKDSGIPWLGEIPEHWEVRRFRTLVHHIDQGVSPLAVGFLAEGDSWGVLKAGCVNRGVFRETEHKKLARRFHIDSAIVVKIGDVLISRACGSPSLVGSVGRVKSLHYKLILSDKIFRPIFRELVEIDFMVFAMNCRYYRHQVEQAISGAEGMANNLPVSSLRDFAFAIPPANEAMAIAEYLESESSGLQIAISRLTREIDLLHEYRTRLVADVVTGKLDVREAAARLPDEVSLDAVEEDADLGLDPEADVEEADA